MSICYIVSHNRKSEESQKLLNKQHDDPYNQEQSNGEDTEDHYDGDRRRCKDYLKAEKYVIPMNSGLKAIFDSFVLIVVTYSIFTNLLYVSFSPEKYEIIETIDNIAFGVFITDFVLSKFKFKPNFKIRLFCGILRSRNLLNCERSQENSHKVF